MITTVRNITSVARVLIVVSLTSLSKCSTPANRKIRPQKNIPNFISQVECDTIQMGIPLITKEVKISKKTLVQLPISSTS